jgi:2'-5' RNA ligase
MSWPKLRNALNVESIHDTHECALTLSLDPELAGFVVGQRKLLGRDDLIDRQLDPHITVLYCGFEDPPAMASLAVIAECFHSRNVEFQIRDIGVFYNRAGLLTNVHYSLESPQLHVLHSDILDAYKQAGLKLHTPYVGRHYTPHISIFDRLAMPKTVSMLLEMPPRLHGHVAGGCHLIGEKDVRS